MCVVGEYDALSPPSPRKQPPKQLNNMKNDIQVNEVYQSIFSKSY